jgi:hypothetical protein
LPTYVSALGAGGRSASTVLDFGLAKLNERDGTKAESGTVPAECPVYDHDGGRHHQLRYKQEVQPGQHPALVDPALWSRDPPITADHTETSAVRPELP